ncbi:MAG: pyridoxal phosphate-dependent aminotransferase [Candidatus Omnitrophica bacterium]|nr:pyridoxal phosphate-dependent aminotransferase [Candidatus Omnitrophota bacterium]
MKIASRVEKITPSLTLQVTSLAKAMLKQGERVVNFAAGEPDFDTPEYIKQAANEAIRQGLTKYTPATGLAELKQAICKKLKRDNALEYSPEQIIVGCGAKHVLYSILQVACEKADEVIIASPYWLSYPEMITLAQGQAKVIETKAQDKFKLTAQAFLGNITKKTRLLILNSPANPTGSVYSQEELKEIAQIVVEKDLYVISDEIYEKIIFDEKKHLSIASFNEQIFRRTIVVNGVSKAFAMTGWRIGYLAAADVELIKAVGNLQSHSTSNPCSISQRAAQAALENEQPQKMQQMALEFQSRRDCMLEGLSAIAKFSFIKPDGAFYVFCNISASGLDSLEFAQRLLKEAKVAVVPGVVFGRDDYVRLSFATSIDEIREGTLRVKNWLENISG